MKFAIVRLLLGTFLALAALWGGAYFLDLYPFKHWANFPVFMTAMVVFIGGAFLAASSFEVA
jgi:hypothetical protein